MTREELIGLITAAEHFVKGKRQNQLTPEHIAKSIDTYQFRKEEPRHARRVDMEEIEVGWGDLAAAFRFGRSTRDAWAFGTFALRGTCCANGRGCASSGNAA